LLKAKLLLRFFWVLLGPPFFYWLLFFCPPPCQPGWTASPYTCNGFWLHSSMAVFSKRTIVFFVTDQTPCPDLTRSLTAEFWLRCTEWSIVSTKPLITEEI
jgi:hypothetical protein